MVTLIFLSAQPLLGARLIHSQVHFEVTHISTMTRIAILCNLQLCVGMGANGPPKPLIRLLAGGGVSTAASFLVTHSYSRRKPVKAQHK